MAYPLPLTGSLWLCGQDLGGTLCTLSWALHLLRKDSHSPGERKLEEPEGSQPPTSARTWLGVNPSGLWFPNL